MVVVRQGSTVQHLLHGEGVFLEGGCVVIQVGWPEGTSARGDSWDFHFHLSVDVSTGGPLAIGALERWRVCVEAERSRSTRGLDLKLFSLDIPSEATIAEIRVFKLPCGGHELCGNLCRHEGCRVR